MSRVPLVTSVPPGLSRVAANGEELGPDWAARCRASWTAAGFTPISVNSAREVEKFGDQFAGVEMLVRPRDARSETGKPLVHFHDLLDAALEAAQGGPVALTNADILLEGRELSRAVAALRPGQALFARRVDVPSPDARQGELYAYGIDFFAMHATDLAKLRDGGFVFGAPWWDYYLPTALLSAQVSLQPIPARHVFHLRHDERWDPTQWRLFGGRFVAQAPDLLAGVAAARTLRNQLLKVTGRAGLASRAERLVAHVATHAWPVLAQRLERRALNRVSALTNRFLDALPPA